MPAQILHIHEKSGMNRLDTQLLVSALLRRVDGAGGFATVLQKGDRLSGIILVQLLERGRFHGLLERMTDLNGQQKMVPCGPKNDDQGIEISDYISKRKRVDPDLWLIELDIAEGERFADEILCGG
jgi:hypothetical protein